VIRRQNKKLRVGWICPTIGTFGAVREMIEVSNVLVKKGHRVYIYHPDGTECKWLKSLAPSRKLSFLHKDSLDVLIGIIDWKPEMYNDFLKAQASVKAVCLLGFEPTEEMARSLRGEIPPQDSAQKMIRDAMQKKFLILTDSSWQVEWVEKNVGYKAGPSFGGINLEMFYPGSVHPDNNKCRIIYSNDPRERKGTDIVEKAIELVKQDTSHSVELEFDSYWGKKFSQDELVNFIRQGDIFLDAHRRAGWCNPVAEAIACGVVPVCTAIGANRDFAIHNKTALTVPVDDAEQMAKETIRLVTNKSFRDKLRLNGLRHIRNFSYRLIVPELESVLEQKVYEQSK
jgi:glycosyltransferase involved in cell wall biosynthesis